MKPYLVHYHLVKTEDRKSTYDGLVEAVGAALNNVTHIKNSCFLGLSDKNAVDLLAGIHLGLSQTPLIEGDQLLAVELTGKSGCYSLRGFSAEEASDLSLAILDSAPLASKRAT